MTIPISRPPIGTVSHEVAGAALDRLLAIAQGDTSGANRVAEFLLAWWDGPTGKFPIIHISNVDGEIAEDMLIILGYLAQNNVTYANAWGRGRDMEQLVEARRG
jgi:hypothetical protein